ncbi:MAG: HlyC/CorC family transporter [Candidatus Aminicenantes bacterium]|nr:HlyC/CorC family transporter [Candidatus Aminicenantes bacterium]
MLGPILLFFLFLALSALFSSSETAYIGANPHTVDYLEKKGSRRAGQVRRILARVDDFLATILIGNTLANAAAAAVATSVFVALVPDRRGAVLLSTAATTLFLLLFSEFNPKVYAAHHPIKLSFFLAPLVRFFMVLLWPLVKAFTFLTTALFWRKSGRPQAGARGAMTEDEARHLLTSGLKGLPAHRRHMISEIFELAARPVKEIMIPRTRLKAIEIGASRDQILEAILQEGFSRFPVYRGRMDHIEGLVYTKDLIPFLAAGKPFELAALLRKPFFLPESASVEKALLQMQDRAVHMAFVVDEFGNMEGIVTLEDILEEIVGDIRDEYDDPEEDWSVPAAGGAFILKGSAGIKAVNKRFSFGLPESADYTTLAGFFLYEFGRLPKEKDVLCRGGRRFIVERMAKRHISLIRVEPAGDEAGGRP